MELQKIFNDRIQAEASRIMDFVRAEVIKSYEAQGHKNTGALADTARNEIHKISNGVLGILFLNDYWKVLETGIAADRVPFSPGSGAKSSIFITKLTEWFKEKVSLDDDEAKKAAFATAYVALREGIPTNASNRFSSTGKRTGFFSNAINENEAAISSGVSAMFGGAMRAVIDEVNTVIRSKIEISL